MARGDCGGRCGANARDLDGVEYSEHASVDRVEEHDDALDRRKSPLPGIVRKIGVHLRRENGVRITAPGGDPRCLHVKAAPFDMSTEDTGAIDPPLACARNTRSTAATQSAYPEEPFHVRAGEHQRSDRRAVRHVVFDPVGGSASIVISQLNHR
jgi:hypothetical protein